MKLSKVIAGLVLAVAIAFPMGADALTKAMRAEMVRNARNAQRIEYRQYRTDLKRNIDEIRRNGKAEIANMRSIHKQEITQAKNNDRSSAEIKAIRAQNTTEIRSLRAIIKQELAAERNTNKNLLRNLKNRQVNDLAPIRNQPVTN